jgi:3'-phosphoadenosine 5'-phosphosulfate sulfotransferase (PAPS reductase)/FAD synthetase
MKGKVLTIYSKEDLAIMQSWDLQHKIQVTTTRIIEWYEYYNGQVYVAFSGGKDSTVLLDIVRRLYPDVPAVFADTGLEFPEVRKFALSQENVVVVKPEMNFRKVIETYGYPVVSKRVVDTVEYGHKPGTFRWKELHGEITRSNGTPSEFNCEKWCYLLNAPFKVSSRCCDVMKKRPMKKYQKKSGRVPIIATMADESRSRRSTWLRQGCNAFSKKAPSSQPMSFWTAADVLEYLYTYNIPYASVYGDIVRTDGGGGALQENSVQAVCFVPLVLIWKRLQTVFSA